ncbi:MAG: hypothetical protein INR73_05600 [Williamsia sp.]|nr:hypothetical protein [Williamsia sp.]
MNQLFALFILIVVLLSCNKESSSKKYPYYNLNVNGSKQPVGACGTSAPVAEYLADTAIFVSLECGGRNAGFSLKGKTTDGTYYLDHKNHAWYGEYPESYLTDSLHRGILSLHTGYQPASAGSAPYIEGEIAFEAIDKRTGKSIQVTKGKFLLNKYQY